MNRKRDAFFLCACLASCAPEEPNPRYDAGVGQAEAGGLDAGGVGQDASMGMDVSVDVDVGVGVDAVGDGDVNTDADASSACAEPCPPARSVCSPEGACEPCSGDDDCAQFPATPLCLAGTCVACKSNADCTRPEASVCHLDDHLCQPCQADAAPAAPADSDCDHLEDAPICHQRTCVQCTAERKVACGDDVCNGLTHACEPGVKEHSAMVCESCVSDAQCQVGQVCVRRLWNEDPDDAGTPQTRELGWFCHWQLGGAGKAAVVQPTDSLCGPGGKCVPKGPNGAQQGAYQCTVECGETQDCPTTIITSCGGAPPMLPNLCSL